MDRAGQVKIIEGLSSAPDSALSESLAKECRTWTSLNATGEPAAGLDTVCFLRDLQDKCVRYGGGSSFVLKLIEVCLADEPEESEESRNERHAVIEASERAS